MGLKIIDKRFWKIGIHIWRLSEKTNGFKLHLLFMETKLQI